MADFNEGDIVTMPGDLARELVDEPGWTLDGWTVAANERVSASRWVSRHRLVIHDGEGNHYAADYRQGLSETQETRPWEDDDTVTFHRVERRTRMVEVVDYLPARQDGDADA